MAIVRNRTHNILDIFLPFYLIGMSNIVMEPFRVIGHMHVISSTLVHILVIFVLDVGIKIDLWEDSHT